MMSWDHVNDMMSWDHVNDMMSWDHVNDMMSWDHVNDMMSMSLIPVQLCPLHMLCKNYINPKTFKLNE